MIRIAAILALLALAACETPSETINVNGVPVDPDVGPATTPAGAAEAGALFRQVCLAHAPAFGGSAAALRGGPFRRAATDVWYHDSLNLSFKLITVDGQPACSLVFASDDGFATLADAIVGPVGASGPDNQIVRADTIAGAAGPAGTSVFLYADGTINGARYFRALLKNN